MIYDAVLHAIPGYGLYHGYKESSDPDIPFAIKVRNVTLGAAAHAFYVVSATEHALTVQDFMIKTKGYYSGPTHGWAAIRNLIRFSPIIAAVTLQAAAGVHIQKGGATGVDLYSQVERQQIDQGMFKHVSGVGSLVI